MCQIKPEKDRQHDIQQLKMFEFFTIKIIQKDVNL